LKGSDWREGGKRAGESRAGRGGTRGYLENGSEGEQRGAAACCILFFSTGRDCSSKWKEDILCSSFYSGV